MEDRKAKIRKFRDGPVSLQLDLEGDDKLVEMIGRDSGLFYISKSKIVRYRSPDHVDPDLEHEEATWTQNLVLPYGASDPIVARTVIQTARMSERFFPRSSDKYKALSDISWEVMNSLISLRFIKQRLEGQVNKIIAIIEDDMDSYTKGDRPKPLPIVEYYDIEFRSFVNEVRRLLSTISELFFTLTGKEEFSKGYFHKAQQWAEEVRGPDSLLAQMLKGDLRWIQTWIDVRIAIEHPKKDKFVETMNFTLEPNRTITLPTWRFVHPDYNMTRPQNLLDVMDICINNLLKFYEDLQFALLDGHLPSSIKVFFDIVPEEDRDVNLPMRYKFY